MVSNNKVEQVILHTIFILLCIIAAAPFLLLISSSITEESTLLQYGYSFFPKKVSFYAYEYLFQSGGKIVRGLGLSVLVTIVGTACSILMTVMFAYPISRKELPHRNLFSFLVFFTMLFNGGLVPTYMMYTQIFHIKNTIWALIIPSLLMNAFYIIMMRSFFVSNIPDSLIEAARIDGAGEFRILFRIVLPLSKPMLATLALMVGLGYWNDWMNSLYYITDDSLYTLQAILNNIITSITFLQSSTMGSVASAVAAMPSTGIRMAIAVVGVIPVLIIYPFFQKYFVKGIVVGGVKG